MLRWSRLLLAAAAPATLAMLQPSEEHDAALERALSWKSILAAKSELLLQRDALRAALTTQKESEAAIVERAARFVDRMFCTCFVLLVAQYGVLFHWVFIMFDWNLVEPMTCFLGMTVAWTGVALHYYNGIDFSYECLRGRLIEWRARKLGMPTGITEQEEKLNCVEKELKYLGSA